MKTATLAIIAAALPAAALAAPGEIATLDRGRYVCSLPGDATGTAVREVPEYNFSITGASSYRSPQGGGTYMRVDDTVTFTSGPRKDMKLHRHASGLLQWIEDDGKLGRVRCSRITR